MLEKHARLPAGLPRRHRAPVDAGPARRAGPRRAVREAAAAAGWSRRRCPTPTARCKFADFTQLSRKRKHPYIALVPQWDLLDLLAGAAKQEPSFTLRMEHRGHRPGRRGRPGHRRRVPHPRRRDRADPGGPDGGGRRAHARCCARPRRCACATSPTPLDVWWFRLAAQGDRPDGRGRRGEPAPRGGDLLDRGVVLADRDADQEGLGPRAAQGLGARHGGEHRRASRRGWPTGWTRWRRGTT